MHSASKFEKFGCLTLGIRYW